MPDATVVFQKAKEEFKMADAKALLFISQALDQTNFDYIAIYDKSSSHRLDRLWTDIFYLEWSQVENIASFISRTQNSFIKANDELRRILECVVPDAMLLFRIISTLQQQYFAFKPVWDDFPLKDRSIELLT